MFSSSFLPPFFTCWSEEKSLLSAMKNLRYIVILILSISTLHGSHSLPVHSEIALNSPPQSMSTSRPSPIYPSPYNSPTVYQSSTDTFVSLLKDGTLKPFRNPTILSGGNDKKVFDRKLEGISFGPEIEGGSNNYGLWEISDYQEKPKHNLLAKFFKESGPQPFGEVKALRMMGLLVASGMIRDPHPDGRSLPLPAIIMEKKEGVRLMNIIVYKLATFQEQRSMVEQIHAMMCRQAVEDAVRFKVYHHDNNLDNALLTFLDKEPVKVIDFIKSVKGLELIDYGGAYMVMKDVSKERLESMFLGQGYEVEMNKSKKKIVFWKIEYSQWE
ncbi:hypothetical protein HHX47_DHR3000154 [Lentinula edodes]|nr:hypothetical protein HHX47_DHR3000154 [Lentinula edodes]